MTDNSEPVSAPRGANGWDEETTAVKPLPAPDPPWSVLVVDDDEEYLRDTAEAIRRRPCAPDGDPPEVLETSSFSEGMDLLRKTTVDVVVLDVRDEAVAAGSGPDEDRGFLIFEELKRLRFLPVVFFTAVESRVEDQDDPPLVHVISKVRGSEAAAEAVESAFRSGAPVAVRALGDHVREVMRQYLWDHIGPKWTAYGEAPRDQLAHLLVGRLAKSLEHGITTELQGALGGALPVPSDWHPSRMYVLPPLMNEHMAGDVVRDRDGRWFVVLTPDCDLVLRENNERKAERLLLAEARVLVDLPDFRQWLLADRESRAWNEREQPPGGFSAEENRVRKSANALAKSLGSEWRAVLSGSRDRYFHLPGFLELPDLLVDLQFLESRPAAELSGLEVVASLNPPYAQALLARYTRYVGRVGLPDPDVDWLIAGFRQRTDEAQCELRVRTAK